MKFKIGIITILICSNSYAQEQISTSTLIESTPPKNWSVSANLESASFNYKEPGVMNENGVLNGVSGQVQYFENSTLWFMGNGTYLSGSAEYNGSLQDEKKTPIKSTDNYKVLDIAAKALLITDLAVDNKVSLFLGLGRRITEDLDDASPNDYYRKHIYNYYSLGVHVVVPHDELTASVIQAGIDTMFSGTTETKLSDVDSSYPDINLKFNGGNALNFEWQLSRIYNGLNLFAGLAYKKWTLARSDVATVEFRGETAYFVEPKNETSTIAFKLGAQF